MYLFDSARGLNDSPTNHPQILEKVAFGNLSAEMPAERPRFISDTHPIEGRGGREERAATTTAQHQHPTT